MIVQYLLRKHCITSSLTDAVTPGDLAKACLLYRGDLRLQHPKPNTHTTTKRQI